MAENQRSHHHSDVPINEQATTGSAYHSRLAGVHHAHTRSGMCHTRTRDGSRLQAAVDALLA